MHESRKRYASIARFLCCFGHSGFWDDVSLNGDCAARIPCNRASDWIKIPHVEDSRDAHANETHLDYYATSIESQLR